MSNKEKPIEKYCKTCKHNNPLLNKKCVGCINYINADKTSTLKWEPINKKHEKV